MAGDRFSVQPGGGHWVKIITKENERVGPWVAERVGGEWTPGRGQAIGIERNGTLVGGFLIEDWNGASCTMHVAGEKPWLTRPVLHYVFDYIFKQLGCKCVFGVIARSNTKTLNLALHAGFEEVISLEEAHPTGDLVVMRMRKNECRWLNG